MSITLITLFGLLALYWRAEAAAWQAEAETSLHTCTEMMEKIENDAIIISRIQGALESIDTNRIRTPKRSSHRSKAPKAVPA